MWRQWLSFSRNERFGLVILFVLVCIVAVFPFVYQIFFFNASPLAQSENFQKVDSFFSALQFVKVEPRSSFSVLKEEAPVEITRDLFVFDPNTITVSDLERLGFSNKQAKVIDNYRKKGGVFRRKDDFAKMYVVDSSMFSRLLPYISIQPIFDSLQLAVSKSVEDVKVQEPLLIELNSTDTLELVKIKGIGKSYARRIVAYRNLLGGFVNKQQLLEVWGLNQELFNSVEQNITVDSNLVQTINLNLVEYDDLRKHPYLSDYQAKSIIYFREKQGSFSSVDEIVKNKLVDKVTFEKINNYLTIK